LIIFLSLKRKKSSNKQYKMVKHLGKIILGSIVLGAIALGSTMIKYDTLERKTENLIKKAVISSAGKDRIWSTEEKREFLDKYGMNDIILGNDQDVYFRVEGPVANVRLGYALRNNGGFLHGSSASSGTKVGKIHYNQLKNLER